MDIILAFFLLIIVFILVHYEFYFLSAIVGLVFVAVLFFNSVLYSKHEYFEDSRWADFVFAETARGARDLH